MEARSAPDRRGADVCPARPWQAVRLLFRFALRGVEAGEDFCLVLEVAFEGLARSSRHKSGVAMRFPRINRIRWDKPAREADELASLERMLDEIEAGHARSRV